VPEQNNGSNKALYNWSAKNTGSPGDKDVHIMSSFFLTLLFLFPSSLHLRIGDK
jgi:hypothetical protein